MKEVIYYPGFEVRSDEWLKFVLLYIDHLSPIIPKEGERFLSPLYRKLDEETDLFVPHQPNSQEGYKATLDVIDLVEKMIRHPMLYGKILGDSDFVVNWRNPRKQNYTLFREKFTEEWETFCVSNNLGQRSDLGVQVERSLGLIYMSFLTHVISEVLEVPPLTDYSELDQISLITRKTTISAPKSALTAKSILELKIPSDLSGINIDKIIAHRNKQDFKTRLHAFHEELDNWITEVEQGQAKGDFLKTRGSAFSDFSDDIVKLGAEFTKFNLGIWLLLSNPATESAYIKEISAGAVLTIGSIIAIRNTWKHSSTRRLTRKYLADLETIR